MKSGRRLLAALSVLAALLLPCGASVLASSPAGAVKSVLRHESNGGTINFDVPAGTRFVSLQGWIPKANRWAQILTRRNPGDGVMSLRVPPRWQGRSIRVVASARASASTRTVIDHQVIDEGRAVTFIASQSGARLYSIEVEKTDGSGWQRISTVAAPADTFSSFRVSVPASLAPDSRLRVVAVSGVQGSGLASPLLARLSRGPVSFAGQSSFRELVTAIASTAGGEAFPASDRTGEIPAVGPTVNQSDIWNVRGSRIYFFNQLRGLQIIDVADRDNPRVLGQLGLPAVGEEMYLLGGDGAEADSAVLISPAPWQPEEPEFTRVLRIGVAGDAPAPQSELEIPGYFVESRMAGNFLHIVTSAWEDEGGTWRPRTWLTSLDLTAPGAIVQAKQTGFDFAASQVGATGKYFWLSGADNDDWSRHRILAFPFLVDGTIGAPRNAVLGGVVLDKFKVGDTGDGLGAVVQSWITPEGTWQQVTAVETLADDGTAALVPRARLELIRDESLFATRFDGSRLYAVTFRQVDPLWLVDISDPAAPAVTAELEVPGWSSFIEPMGDVLLAVGREDGRVQVSLFDVSDPAAPSLAQRLYLGSSYSWSEAEWDERAVRILREEGLVLLPVTEHEGTTSVNKVALVDFDASTRTLRARGAIAHDFAPRRATLLDGTAIASVSNRELVVVDASDRDNPLLSAKIVLAFGSELVAAKGGVVYQFESGSIGASDDAGRAIMRIAPATDPTSVLREIRLESSGVAAASVFGDRLYVVERDRRDFFLPVLSGGGGDQESSTRAFLSAWSLGDPSDPVLLGRAALDLDALGTVELLETTVGHVVVTDRSSGWFGRPYPLFVRPAASPAVASDARIALPWFGMGNSSIAVDVVDVGGETLRLAGSWVLSGDDISGVSEVFAAGDLLAFSFVRSTPESDLLPPTEVFVGTAAPFLPPEWSRSVRRTWLQILDLADPSSPMPWAPVEIPGDLAGVAWLQRAGGVFFAKSGEARDRVAALGFDGERATLVAEVEVGSGPLATSGRTLFVGHEGGVRELTFSEEKAAWRSGEGWSLSAGYVLDGLHSMDGALLASGAGQIWALFGDGSIVSAPTAGPGDVHLAAQLGGLYFVPSGDYGTLTLAAP